MDTQKQIGIIKWFDNEKGYGVINTSYDEEYFIHKSNFLSLITEKISIDALFIFEKGIQKGRKTAFNCKTPSTQDDFIFCLNLISQLPDFKNIEEVIKNNSFRSMFIKKELKEFKISINCMFLILNNKPYESVKDYLMTGFQQVIRFLKIEKVIEYYKISKQLIQNIDLFDNFKYILEEHIDDDFGFRSYSIKKFDLSDNSLNQQQILEIEAPKGFLLELINKEKQEKKELLIKELIEYYNSELSDYLKLKIWQSGDFYASTSFFGYSESPVKEDLFIDYYEELNSEQIKKICSFNINSEIKIKIIEKQLIDKYSHFFDLVYIIKLAKTSNVTELFFYKIFNRIDDELLFRVWYSKEIYFNPVQKSISFNYPSLEDFDLPIKLLLKNIEKINYVVIKRISATSKNKDEILKEILKEKITKKLIVNENIVEFINSVQLLEEEYQEEILSLFIANIEPICIKILIENKLFFILPNSVGLILSYKFQISLKLAKYLSDTIFQISIINYEEKLKYLKNLSPIFLSYYTRKTINQISDNEKISIIKIASFEIIDFILSNWNFEDNKLTKNIFKLSKSINFQLNEKFLRSFENDISKFEIIDLIEIYNYYPDNLIIEIISKKFQSNSIAESTFSKFIEFHNQFSTEVYKSIEQQINSYIINILQENNKELLIVIEKSSSLVLLSSAIRKCNSMSNIKQYLNLIKENIYIHEIDKDLIYNNLINYISEFPILILEIAILKFPSLYDLFAQKIKLNHQVLIDFYTLLINNKDTICKLSVTDCDINTLAIFHNSFDEPENINKLNNLFKNNQFKFQSITIKFYCLLFKKGEISKTQLLSIIKSINCVELSALMIKSFVNEKFSNKEELISLMNLVFKSHFKYLNEYLVNDETFNNIFSIENLVKNCDGRTEYSNIKTWDKGETHRLYVDGKPRYSLISSLDIYCEGRQWKSSIIYDSKTNKPIDEAYVLYYCQNKPCARVNDKTDFNLPYYQWTLLELNELLDINLDRLAFVYLAGWLNRMKSILDRLKCKECNNYLRPKAFTPNLLGYYAVPIFICVNENCSLLNKEIRFTHCRGCKKILDSRECIICKTCNWLICDDKKCGKCGCGANYNPVYAEY